MEENRLTVVYATDRKLYSKLPTVINSLLTHNPEAKIYVFAEDDSIDVLTHPNITIKNLNMFRGYISPKSPQFAYYIPYPTFTRLWMAEVLKESKVLWLDVDTIVDGNLDELWNMDMGDNIVGGVLDKAWTRYPKINDKYINAGVLLMDLDKWRELGFIEKSKEIVNKESLRFGDQDIINKLCRGRILNVNSRYNYGRYIYTTFATFPIKIYHWPGKPKAWDSKEKTDKDLWDGYFVEKI